MRGQGRETILQDWKQIIYCKTSMKQATSVHEHALYQLPLCFELQSTSESRKGHTSKISYSTAVQQGTGLQFYYVIDL